MSQKRRGSIGPFGGYRDILRYRELEWKLPCGEPGARERMWLRTVVAREPDELDDDELGRRVSRYLAMGQSDPVYSTTVSSPEHFIAERQREDRAGRRSDARTRRDDILAELVTARGERLEELRHQFASVVREIEELA